jgi:hypothetical protein
MDLQVVQLLVQVVEETQLLIMAEVAVVVAMVLVVIQQQLELEDLEFVS